MGVFKKKDAPSTPSAEESFLSQVDTLGKAYEKFLPILQEYEPQFLQQQLDSQRQFAPEFAQLERDTLEQVNPEGFGALNQLSGLLESRGDLSSLNMSPEITRALQQDVRAGQAARGIATSPISALTEGVATLGQRISERDKFINLAQVLSGRAPGVQSPQVSSSQMGVFGAPQISSMTSLQQQANNLAFSRWDREQQERQRITGAVTGGIMTAGSLAAAPFTGGASLMMLPGGINTMTGTNASSSMNMDQAQKLYASFA